MHQVSFKHRIISSVLTAVLILSAVPAYAHASAQDQLDEANSELDAANSELDEAADELDAANSQIDELESEQAELEASLAAYESSLSELAEELDELVAQIDAKQEEIDEAQEEINVLKVSIEEQEELIRDRAQYVYENSGSSSLKILLSSTSFADFLNKVQYLNDLNEYDNEVVDEYNAMCTEMTELKNSLETEKADLEILRDESLSRQDTMYSLIEETNQQIAANESELANAEAAAAELEEQVEMARAAANAASAQVLKAELEAEQEAQQEAQSSSTSDTASSSEGSSSASESSSSAQSASDTTEDSDTSDASDDSESADDSESSTSSQSETSSSSSSSSSASSGDVTLLAALIYCEAGGESYEGKLAVGSVVINRVNSSRFPNTISGVIYQTGQFSPASNGRLASALANGSYSGDSLSAAKEVLAGNITISCLYFNAAGYYSGSYTLRIGNQVFY